MTEIRDRFKVYLVVTLTLLPLDVNSFFCDTAGIFSIVCSCCRMKLDMEVVIVNVLIVAESEEAEKIRSFMEMETSDSLDIRYFQEESCAGALKKVSANPYLYGILFVGRKITDRSELSDAEAIHRIYSLNPRILICMSTTKNYLSYDFCSIPCVCTIRSPVSQDQIHSMLERMSKIEKTRYGDPAFRVPVYKSNEVMMIPAASIRYARKVRNGLEMITECGSFINRRKMDSFEKHAGKMFIRCHGSYIVNLSHVTMLQGSWLEMDDGAYIPVSRQYQNKVRQCLADYHMLVTVQGH